MKNAYIILLGHLETLRRDVSGAVLVEMTLLTPLLVLLFATAIQWGLIFYTHSSMESAVRAAARELSVGDADDETNGTLMNCASLSGIGADGNPSAEQIACNQVAGLAGTFSVAATDGAAGGFGAHGADARVTLQVERDSIVIVDPLGLIAPSKVFSAEVIMRNQNPGN